MVSVAYRDEIIYHTSKLETRQLELKKFWGNTRTWMRRNPRRSPKLPRGTHKVIGMHKFVLHVGVNTLVNVNQIRRCVLVVATWDIWRRNDYNSTRIYKLSDLFLALCVLDVEGICHPGQFHTIMCNIPSLMKYSYTLLLSFKRAISLYVKKKKRVYVKKGRRCCTFQGQGRDISSRFVGYHKIFFLISMHTYVKINNKFDNHKTKV